MKTLGTDQFLAMKFDRLPLSDTWQGVMGRMSECFTILFYGPSGNGKTEGCLQFAKELARFGKVEWMEYESGHAADIQDAVSRNNMKGLAITWTDPWEIKKSKPSKALLGDIPMSGDPNIDQRFIELVEKIAKKKSAKYWFFNSNDAMEFSPKQVLYLMRKFGKKKGLVFIGLADGKTLRTASSKVIYAQGQASYYVKNYICGATKTRFGGWGKHVIYEAKARELDPLFFAQQEQNQAPKIEKKKRGRKPKATTEQIPAKEAVTQ